MSNFPEDPQNFHFSFFFWSEISTIHSILTACSVTSKFVIVSFLIDTKAGDVYADEYPTTIEPIETAMAARI